MLVLLFSRVLCHGPFFLKVTPVRLRSADTAYVLFPIRF